MLRVGFILNFNKDKTEAIVCLKGRDAKLVRSKLFGELSGILAVPIGGQEILLTNNIKINHNIIPNINPNINPNKIIIIAST